MTRPSRLLLVDDDLAMRLRLRDLLEREGGYELHDAVDGPAALERVHAVDPDLVLLDVMMPGMSGFEVCSALRTDPRTREVPIVMLSAASENETMVAALEAGADDFLRKPVSGHELRAKVRSITRLNRYRTLAGERDRFHSLLERSPEPLIVADADGTLVYANRQARETFALERAGKVDVATAIGRHYRADPADAWAAWRELRLPADTVFTVFRPESERGASRYYEVELQALDEAGRQTLFRFTNRSVSIRRELEVFTFRHLLSHKIRTPLYDIVPILGILQSSPHVTMDCDTATLLRSVRESTERLEETLTQVVDYHAAVLDPRRTEIPAPPRTLHEILFVAAGNAGMAGRVRATVPGGRVARPEMLEIVLTELFQNYATFSAARTTGVEVTLHAAGGGHELRLTAASRPDPLFRHEAPAVEGSGMGLGVVTVRQLLRWHGGDLRFATTETGEVRTRLMLPPDFLV